MTLFFFKESKETSTHEILDIALTSSTGFLRNMKIKKLTKLTLHLALFQKNTYDGKSCSHTKKPKTKEKNFI